MRQLHYVLGVLFFASLLISSSGSHLSSCNGDITDTIVSKIIKSQNASVEPADIMFTKLCDNLTQTEIYDPSVSNRAISIRVEYRKCENVTTCPDFVRHLVDAVCSMGVWSMRAMGDAGETVVVDDTNCSECVNGQLYAQYPSLYSFLRNYNATTHCLILPECKNVDETIGFLTVQDCCIGREESTDYVWEINGAPETFQCIVNGFRTSRIEVIEGETVMIYFGRSAKGRTDIPRLQMGGRIDASGDLDDVVVQTPIGVGLEGVMGNITFMARTDNISLEEGDKVVLNYSSSQLGIILNGIEQFNELMSTTLEIFIIDRGTELRLNLISQIMSENDPYLEVTGDAELQDSFTVTLSASESTDVSEQHMALAGKDFVNGTVTVEAAYIDGLIRVDMSNVIIDDTTIEFEEKFQIKFTDSKVSFASGETEFQITIEDMDSVTVRILNEELNFMEVDDGPFYVCMTTKPRDMESSGDCPINIPVNFTINITKYSEDSLESNTSTLHDGETVCPMVTLLPCETEACVDLKSQYDSLENDDEHHRQKFEVRLVPKPILLTRDLKDTLNISVSIDVEMTPHDFEVEEDDILILELDSTVYNVFELPEEDNKVLICLNVTNADGRKCPIGDAFFYFRVSTTMVSGNSAATPDNDFVAVGPPFMRKNGLMKFNECALMECFNITILSDTVDERVESFRVSVWLENDGAKYANITGDSAIINILPAPIITLDESSKIANESDGGVKICCTITYDDDLNNFIPNETIVTELHPLPQSGSRPRTADEEDYNDEVKFLNFTIGSDEKQLCTNIEIFDDNITENSDERNFNRESFRVELRSGLGRNDFTIVEIKDDEDITVRLVDLENVTEGGLLEICAEVVLQKETDCPIGYSAGITFMAVPYKGSATSGDDFVPLSYQKNMQPCEKMVCIELNTTEDNILEETEDLYVRLGRSLGLSSNVHVDNGESVVYIMDNTTNEVILFNSEGTNEISERNSIEYCLRFKYEVSDICPIEYQFQLNVMLEDEQGKILFEDEIFDLPKCEQPGDGKYCVTIPLDLEDDILTNTNTSYTLKMSGNGTDNILLPPVNLVIYDDEMLMLDIQLVNGNSVEEGGLLNFSITPSMPLCQVWVDFNVTILYGYNDDYDKLVDSYYYKNQSDCDRPVIYLTNATEDDNTIEIDEMIKWNTELITDSMLIVLTGEYYGSDDVKDNDVGVIAFKPSDYRVSEQAGSVEICVQLVVEELVDRKPKCTGAAFDIPLQLVASDITAMNGRDYNFSTTTLTIPSCVTDACIDIKILPNDDMDEEEKQFNLTRTILHVQDLNEYIITPPSDSVIVTIVEGVAVDFTEDVYMVYDNETKVDVCIDVRNGECSSDVKIMFATSDGSAVNGIDYISKTLNETISNCSYSCFSIEILNDPQLYKNPTKSFTLSFTATDITQNVTITESTEVVIIDSTEIFFSLDLDLYEVEERNGKFFNVCVKIDGSDCPILFPYEFFMSTTDITAKSVCDFDNKTDYVVNMNASQCRRCVPIDIYDDGILEEVEEFKVYLTKLTPDYRIRLNNSDAIVKIIDSTIEVNVKFENYTFKEDDGIVSICATIDGNCPVQPAFSYIITNMSMDAVYGDDYIIESNTLDFGPCQNKSCVNVEIFDNDDDYEKPEEFSVKFEKSSETGTWLDRIEPTVIVSTVTIEDKLPNVTVKLDPLEYHIRDNQAMPLEVCATISFPVAFDFTIKFSLSGNGVDENEDVKVEKGTTEVCAKLTFEVDADPGELKVYQVLLSRVGGDANDKIVVDPTPAVIQVCDEIECVVDCYTTESCSGDPHINATASGKLCCTGDDASMSYMDFDTGTCRPCIVHGFSKMIYKVVEGDLAQIVFQKNVKGTSSFSNLDIVFTGEITSKPYRASPSDYEAPNDVETSGEGPYTIPVVTFNDDISLEYEDKVIFNYKAYYNDSKTGKNYVKMLEEAGEFIRENTYLYIEDNDDLEINFDEMIYEVMEGSGKTVKLDFRKTQDPFTLNVRAVDYDQLMALRPQMMGSKLLEDICPATEGVDFRVNPFSRRVTTTQTTSFPSVTASSVISTVNDAINENVQTYFLVADVVLEKALTNTKVCFKKYEKDPNCTQNGTALVRIIDNDDISIGFTRSFFTINEADIDYTVLIDSNRDSERDYILNIDTLKAKSDAIIEAASDDGPYVDATMEDLDFELDFLSYSDAVNFTVRVKKDMRYEGTECFYLRVTPKDQFRHEFKCNSGGRYCETRICLRDPTGRPCDVKFSQSSYTVLEEDKMEEICVEMDCYSGSENTVTVDVISRNDRSPIANGTYPNVGCMYRPDPQDCDDYYKQILGCNGMKDIIIEEDTMACFNLTIVDDERLEVTEYTGLSLQVKTETALTGVTRPTTRIQIDDSDVASVGFVGDVTVMEGKKAEVCVEVKSPNIDCPIKYPFSVRVRTSDDSAVVGQDYNSYNGIITFRECEKMRCVNISTNKGSCNLEREEKFTVTLTKYGGGGVIDRISLEMDEISVYITDNDSAIVIFEQESSGIRVRENVGDVPIRMRVVDATRPTSICLTYGFLVGVNSKLGTAVNGEDFVQIGNPITFAPNQYTQSTKVTIVDDKTVEPLKEEYFTVEFTVLQGLPPRLMRGPPLNITITDDDTAIFGLEEASCTVIEGNVLQVCVVKKPPISPDCPVKFEFPLNLTVNKEDTTSADHNATSMVIMMSECTRKTCKNIGTIGDMSLEPDEDFSISLRRTQDLDDRILLTTTKKAIEIEDSDRVEISFVAPFEALEGDIMTVCLAINGKNGSTCPAGIPMRLRFSTRDGTAKSTGSRPDYRRVFTTITIPACAMSYCVNITTIEDWTVELDETFSVTIASDRGLNPLIYDSIMIPFGTEDFTIYNDDTAMVNFDETMYTVTEGGDVLVCVNIMPTNIVANSCPVEYAVTVNLDLAPETADPDDYCDISQCNLTVPVCENRKCERITTCDDCNLEMDENFTITMGRYPGTTRDIKLDTRIVTVTIMDNDRLLFMVEEKRINVMENVSIVEVCAGTRDECRSSYQFNLRLRTVNDSAESSGNSVDYVDKNEIVTITTSNTRVCIEVEIIDNTQTEQLEESFDVVLSKLPNTPDRVVIVDDCDVTMVAIEDDDTAVMGFDEVEISFDENMADMMVLELCIEVKSTDIECPIVFPVVFTVETRDITATGGSNMDEGVDYVIPKSTFRYDACEQKDCIEIEVNNDILVEGPEQFEVSIAFDQDPAGNTLSLVGDVILVTINDRDEATVDLERTLYEVNESRRVIEICAVLNTPMNILFAVSFYTEPIEEPLQALEEEDFTPVTDRLIYFMPGKQRNCTTVNITHDCVLEEIEKFHVGLLKDPIGSEDDPLFERIKVGEGEGYVIIKDERKLYVKPMPLTLPEDEDGKFCMMITDKGGEDVCSNSKPFGVNVTTMRNSADPFDDYIPEINRTVTFDAGANNACIPIMLVNDVTVEQTESFKYSINLEKAFNSHIIANGSAEIIITNDDNAIIGLEMNTYTVLENETLEVCVQVYAPFTECPVAFPMEIDFIPSDGTARYPGDYSLRQSDADLRFGRCENISCLDITPTNDVFIEDTEYFTISIAPPDETFSVYVELDPDEATIFIDDEDIAKVGFSTTVYSTTEGATITICLRVYSPPGSCPVKTDFSMTIFDVQGNATKPEDYNVGEDFLKVTFSRCSTSQCASRYVTITNDVQVEGLEYFELLVSSDNESLAMADPDTARVYIRDTDTATVQLQETSYTVTEGINGTVRICAEITRPKDLPCLVDFDFVLKLTVDTDGDPVVYDIRFDRCGSSVACANVRIIDDNRVENTKPYTYRLTRPSDVDRRIGLARTSGTLVIEEDPSDIASIELIIETSSRNENDRFVEVCAVIISPTAMNPVDFTFNIEISTEDDTAVSIGSRRDFNRLTSRNLYFRVGIRRVCINITVFDDHTEEKDECFFVSLNRRSNTPNTIDVDDTPQKITILDSDPVTIDLERSEYTVREDVGSVQICLLITNPRFTSCPIQYNDSVSITIDTGNISRADDIVELNGARTVQILPCSRKTCFEIEIVDDLRLEKTEYFQIQVRRNSLDADVELGVTVADVYITDEDTAEIKFSASTYSVEEGDTVSVCVRLGTLMGCNVPLPFCVNITSHLVRRIPNPNLYTAAAQEDFTIVNVTQEFGPCTNELCFSVSTNNDEDVEGTEVFDLSLEFCQSPEPDDRLSIPRASSITRIFIEDDDSARVNVQSPSYTVNEDNRTVEVCAAVRSPFPASDGCELEFSFSVYLDKIPGSAGTSDYSSSTQIITFPRCATVACTRITIINDVYMEEVEETFQVSLRSRNTPSAVRVSSQPSTITIVDNDRLTYGFERTSYTVSESSSSVQLCARVIRGSSDIPNTIRISTSPETATTGSPSDFVSVSVPVTFARRETRKCINIAITNDDTVEEREYFSARLQSPDSLDNRVALNPSQTTVYINDNDNVRVRLVEGAAEANESTTVTFKISAGDSFCPVAFAFTVTFTASTSSTAKPGDYILPREVTVPACRSGILEVEILEDDILETDERLMFTGSISASRVTYAGGTTTIIIKDNEQARISLPAEGHEFFENNGTVKVCAESSMMVDFPFMITFIFTSDSASYQNDYTPRSTRGPYDKNTNKACANLRLINSPSVEMPESLFVSIEVYTPGLSAVAIDPNGESGTIVIRDDDNAIIGFDLRKPPRYDVDDNSVRVCLLITEPTTRQTTCPIAFPFDIEFRLSPNASEVFEVDERIPSNDDDDVKKGAHSILLFNSCQREFCFDVTRKSNGTDVNVGDKFSITLIRTPDHGINIDIDPSSANITVVP